MKRNDRRTLKEITAGALLEEDPGPRTIAQLLGEDGSAHKVRHWALEGI